MDTSGPSHKCQDFVRVALIHRSAWKWNSAKFTCTILYSSCLSGRVLPFNPGPKRSTQHYMLWWWIKMHRGGWGRYFYRPFS